MAFHGCRLYGLWRAGLASKNSLGGDSFGACGPWVCGALGHPIVFSDKLKLQLAGEFMLRGRGATALALLSSGRAMVVECVDS